MAYYPEINMDNYIDYKEGSEASYEVYDDDGNYEQYDAKWSISGSGYTNGYITMEDPIGYQGSQTYIANENTTNVRQTATLKASNSKYGTASITIYAEPWNIKSSYLNITLPSEIFSTGQTLTGSASLSNPAPYDPGYTWTVSGNNVNCSIYSSGTSYCYFYITGNSPSLSTNTTVTITVSYGTKSNTKTMLMKPSLTGIQILSQTNLLNVNNNFDGIINVRALPVGTGAPITYTATTTDSNKLTIGTITAKGDGTYNIPISGKYNYYGSDLKVTAKAALTPNPSVAYSATTNAIQIRPNMRTYNSSWRRGQPSVYVNGTWREGVEVYIYANGAWKPANVK